MPRTEFPRVATRAFSVPGDALRRPVRKGDTLRCMSTRLALVCWLTIAFATPSALATANYVYHEQTMNLTGGTCGNYLDTPAPDSTDTYPLRVKIEYQFYTTNVSVYYTADGTMPSGTYGTPVGNSTVVPGVYSCTFAFAGQTIDVATAMIPPQPAGTTVSYIVSAWYGPPGTSGPEVFANSGTCSGCTPCEMASCATVFQYTVTGGTGDAGSDAAVDGAVDAPQDSATDAGMDAPLDVAADATSADATHSDTLATGNDTVDASPTDATFGNDVSTHDVPVELTDVHTSEVASGNDAGTPDVQRSDTAAGINDDGVASVDSGPPDTLPPLQSCACRTAASADAGSANGLAAAGALLMAMGGLRRRGRASRRP